MFNRIFQSGQIDGIDDTNYLTSLLPYCPKIKKNRCSLRFIQFIYQWVRFKGSEATDGNSKPGIEFFKHFISEAVLNSNCFRKNFGPSVKKFFVVSASKINQMDK